MKLTTGDTHTIADLICILVFSIAAGIYFKSVNVSLMAFTGIVLYIRAHND